MKSSKSLVIGGTGYIGAAVDRQLQASGHHPVVMVHDRSEHPRKWRAGSET